MAEFFEFGGKQNIQHRDKLEHYRLQIKKLKELNYILEQRYEKKIQNLQQQLKNNGKSSHGYHPSGKTNQQILKRDQQINRLREEVQKLKRQNNHNPDKQLIAKKRQLFDLVADKDQQIMQLKKTMHELQNRYNGKYFNESQFKKRYDILVKQNEQLKRELMNVQSQEEKKTQINRDILDGIRYKKEYELMVQQNEHLKNQVSRLSMVGTKNVYINKTLGQNTHNQLLKSEVHRNSVMNEQILREMNQIKNQNKELKHQNQALRRTINLKQGISQNNNSQVRSSKRRIFDRKSISSSSSSSNQMDPQNFNHQSTARKTGLYSQFGLDQIRKSNKNI